MLLRVRPRAGWRAIHIANFGQSRPQLVTHRTQDIGQSSLGGAGATNYTRSEGRIKVKTGPNAGATNIQLVFPGWYVLGNGTGESNAPNAITVEAAIETIAPAQAIRVTFGGQNTVTVNPGDTIVSDPVPGLTIPAGSFFWVRTGLTVASAGLQWPRGYAGSVSGENFIESTSATSQILATGSLTTPTGGAGGAGYGPVAIIGTLLGAQPTVINIGDSINDTTNDSGDGNGNFGFVARGLWNSGNVVPYTRLTRGSDRATSWVTAGSNRMALLKYASNVICELGTNDINTSRTLAQIQSDLQTIWQAAKAAGVRRVAQTLIIPRTTSTDSWATAANQTPVSGFATGSTRDQLNAWIKAQVGQGLLDGYIDPNPQVEDQANLGKWQTNGTASFATTDGTHPTAAFQASMATVVTNYIPNLV